MRLQPEALLRRLFATAIEAAQAEHLVRPFLPDPPDGRTIVVGCGKAAAAMAREVEKYWPQPLEGLVVVPYGHADATRYIEVVQAAHPVPDAAGLDATRRILDRVLGLTRDDLVLFLVSGGGSVLMTLPAPGVSLEDKREINTRLLASGATIAEINCVRKHLSAVKGGRLAAAAAPARVVTLAISDVPGDDPAVIASGPTVADPTTFADALAILHKHAIDRPAAVVEHLRAAREETPKSSDERFSNHVLQIIATPQASLEAAAAAAREAGLTPFIHGDALEGEAREVAVEQADLVRRVLSRGQPVAPPCVLISGGETTVTLQGTGRGGRNSEFLLALAIALQGMDRVWGIAADTDGIDGNSDAAGAVIAPDSLARAAAGGLEPDALLGDNDSYGFFRALDDLVMTGPTLTNVNDFRAILITGP